MHMNVWNRLPCDWPVLHADCDRELRFFLVRVLQIATRVCHCLRGCCRNGLTAQRLCDYGPHSEHTSP